MPKRRFWNPLKRKKYSAQTMRNRSQKTAETLLLEPTKNKEKACKPPGQTQEKGVWDAHAKKQNPSRFCARAIAKPKRRFWNPLKRKKYSAQKRKKYSAHTIRNRSQKSTETLFLEPTKNKACPSHCETSATRQSETSATRQSLRKLRRERIRKGRAPAGFVPKPLRNRSRKNAETSLLEPTKNKQKTKKKQRNSALATRTSHCETAAGKMPKRCFWNPLKRKKDPAGFASKPLRNCNLKNLETLLLEPLKTMESCPSHCETSATRQSETSATRQSLRKLRRERIRKSRAPAGFVPKPLRNRSRKNAETSLLEPTKNKQKTKKKQRNSALATRTSHCETAAGKMPKRRFWNPLKRKKECPNHAKPQPENCRNVAFGTY